MITPFDIYLISMADDVINFLACAIILIIFLSIIYGIWYETIIDCIRGSEKKEINIKFSKIFKKILFWGILVGLGLMFIPSTKTLIAMYSIPPIVNNKSVQELPITLINFANSWLEKNNGDK